MLKTNVFDFGKNYAQRIPFNLRSHINEIDYPKIVYKAIRIKVTLQSRHQEANDYNSRSLGQYMR